MFVGNQKMFAGTLGHYFVSKENLSQGKITLICVLGLFTNYRKGYISFILLGKIALFGLDASYKLDLSFL